MKNSLIAGMVCIALIGAFLGGSLYSGRSSAEKPNAKTGRRILHYVDPMNPAYTSDRPGVAPCGMPLDPVYAEKEGAEGSPGQGAPSLSPAAVAITAQKQQIIGVEIGTAELKSETHMLRALGRIAPVENRVYRLSAGFEGYMLDVYGSDTGSYIQKGQLMATYLVRDFPVRQQQYLATLNYGSFGGQAQQNLPQQGPAQLKVMSQQAYLYGDPEQSTRLDLLNMGLGESQIQDIIRTRQPSGAIEVRSPATGIVLSRSMYPNQRFEKGEEFYKIADLSSVWVIADVFEHEVKYIRPGMKARVTLPRQDQTFEATVSNIPPQFDASTRTLKVRMETDNPQYSLRPDMFVDVEFLISFPPSLTVPADAILDSGMRRIVFVDLGNGYFEPRAVQTGWRRDDKVEIIDGLAPGERIVTSGNFLIDSESRMKLAAAGLHGTPGKDPICGAEVYPGKAKPAGLTTRFDGREYLFCSPGCKAEFEKWAGVRMGAHAQRGANPMGMNMNAQPATFQNQPQNPMPNNPPGSGGMNMPDHGAMHAPQGANGSNWSMQPASPQSQAQGSMQNAPAASPAMDMANPAAMQTPKGGSGMNMNMNTQPAAQQNQPQGAVQNAPAASPAMNMADPAAMQTPKGGSGMNMNMNTPSPSPQSQAQGAVQDAPSGSPAMSISGPAPVQTPDSANAPGSGDNKGMSVPNLGEQVPTGAQVIEMPGGGGAREVEMPREEHDAEKFNSPAPGPDNVGPTTEGADSERKPVPGAAQGGRPGSPGIPATDAERSMNMTDPEARNAGRRAPGSEPNVSIPSQQSKLPPGVSRDPVCGTMVRESIAREEGLTSEFQGKLNYFCRKHCKVQFDKGPARYFAVSAGGEERAENRSHGETRHD